MDILFVNKIPFLITLICNTNSADTIHLPTQKARDIFKSFWRIYVFYLKRGFKITIVCADEELAPVRELILEIPSGPIVNVTSANKSVPKID